MVDQQVSGWACQKPEDWQLGGKCTAYLWGGGRRGQLAESSTGLCTPAVATSFSNAQLVTCTT